MHPKPAQQREIADARRRRKASQSKLNAYCQLTHISAHNQRDNIVAVNHVINSSQPKHPSSVLTALICTQQ